MRLQASHLTSKLTETHWLLLAGSLALVFYVVNAAHYGNLPLRIEENEWPPMAEAIYHTGKPVIAARESHLVRFTGNLEFDETPYIGAWHPPLYLYTLAVSMAFLGTHSPHLLRAVGSAGLLAAAVLLLLIAREVTPRWRLVGGVAAILLLIHPYAIQGSLFLDIDTSIYAPILLLAIWAAIRCARRTERLEAVHILAIGSCLALVTWTKMTTAIVLVGVLGAWWLLSRRPIKRAAFEAAAFVAVGAALFFSTYALWCKATGIPFSYTFNVTFVGKSNRLLSNPQLVENAAHWHLRWFGPALLLLALVYLADLLRNLYRTRRLRAMDLPFLFAVGVLATYIVFSPTDGTYQGKYAFPALASLILPITWMLLRRSSPRVRPVMWIGATLIGVATALMLPDLLTGLSFGSYGSWSFDLRIIALAGMALLLAWLLDGSRRFAGGVLVVVAVLGIAQAVRSYHADSSPMYPISDTADFREGIDDLNQNMRPGDIVLAPKDLAFYVTGRVIPGEDAFARGDARTAAAIRRYPEIVAVAHDSFGPPIGPETEALVNRCFLNRHEYGTVTIAYRTKRCR